MAANITPTPEWTAIPGWDRATPDDGLEMNKQGQALANRVELLKQRIDALPDEVDAAGTATAKVSAHNADAAAHPALSAFITSEATAATAAKTAAEAARDAALIQAGVYVDEPTGRAAVADGQAFKVQGNGAVAAYEYRRTSSAASVQIAAYPSVDGVWQFRGEITNATDLNTLTKSGSYHGVKTSSYPNTPAGFSGKDFMLIVVDGFGVNSRFQLWRIQEWGNPNNVLQRWFDINNPTANAWVGVVPSDGSVTAGKLTTDFNYRGYASSGSANSYLKAGVYMVNAALTDMPSGAPTAGYLEVAVAGDGFLVQRFSGLTDQSKRWRRYIRTTTSTYGAWVSEGIPDDASVGISKLTTTFSNRGYATADANNFTSTGIHLVTNSIYNLPAGAPTAGYLEVAQTNDGYLVQTYSGLSDPSKVWRRYIRVSTSTYGAWGSVSSPFAGKKIAFIGDSITHLGDYPMRVATRLGCNSLKLGFSGCRMAQHTGDYDALSFYRLADAISSGVYTPVTAAAASLTTSTGTDYNTPAALLASTSWSTVDYMVVLFGTNDWGGSVPLGMDADATGGTFKGAINYAVNKILTAYPNIKMLFMAPPWRARMSAGDGLDADTNPNGNGVYLLDFVDAVKSRANANKLPAIDLYRESGINKYNQATLLADGLHPAPGIGYQLIADKVSAGLLSKY